MSCCLLPFFSVRGRRQGNCLKTQPREPESSSIHSIHQGTCFDGRSVNAMVNGSTTAVVDDAVVVALACV